MSDEAKPWWQPGPHDAAAITVEPHGPGEAIYLGRDEHHHGLNIALVTETDPARWPAVRERLCATRLDDDALEAIYDALELVGDDRTPEGAAQWARTYVAMARSSGWLP